MFDAVKAFVDNVFGRFSERMVHLADHFFRDLARAGSILLQANFQGLIYKDSGNFSVAVIGQNSNHVVTILLETMRPINNNVFPHILSNDLNHPPLNFHPVALDRGVTIKLSPDVVPRDNDGIGQVAGNVGGLAGSGGSAHQVGFHRAKGSLPPYCSTLLLGALTPGVAHRGTDYEV